MVRVMKQLVIVWCFLIFAIGLIACATPKEPEAQLSFPIGNAWHKLTLYEKEQVVERYEQSKRAPLKKKSIWSLFEPHPDLLVTVSWREHHLSGQPGTDRYDLMLRDGACEVVRLSKLDLPSHKPASLKVCWRREQLSIAAIDVVDGSQAASILIQPHPMWPFGLWYPHLKSSNLLDDLSVYVRSQTPHGG